MLCSVNTNITGGILRSDRLQWTTLMTNISVRCPTVPRCPWVWSPQEADQEGQGGEGQILHHQH